MTSNIDNALKFITTNKAITTTSEIMAEFPELTAEQLNIPEITKALQQNRIKMQSALKIKLFKSNTTQSLLELDKRLNTETNSNVVTDYINNLVDRWFTGYEQ